MQIILQRNTQSGVMQKLDSDCFGNARKFWEYPLLIVFSCDLEPLFRPMACPCLGITETRLLGLWGLISRIKVQCFNSDRSNGPEVETGSGSMGRDSKISHRSSVCSSTSGSLSLPLTNCCQTRYSLQLVAFGMIPQIWSSSRLVLVNISQWFNGSRVWQSKFFFLGIPKLSRYHYKIN